MSIYLLLLLSAVVVILANIVTRFFTSTSTIYDDIPKKYFLENSKLLRLYIVYPKSEDEKITKSCFCLYCITIILFVLILIMSILQITLNIIPATILLTFPKIYFGVVIIAFFASLAVDTIIYYITKHKGE